jgi:SAM-dependent methyltransferase
VSAPANELLQLADLWRTVASRSDPIGRVLVVTTGDPGVVQIFGDGGAYFPDADGGAPLGYHLPTDSDAVALLEKRRDEGATHLVFPASAFWWFDRYRAFSRYLDTHYRLIAASEDHGAIFLLSPWMGQVRPRFAIDLPASFMEQEPAIDRDVRAFRCNICGGENRARFDDLPQEGPSCRGCGSSVRWRAIVHVLSIELFGRSIRLDQFPTQKSVVGIGMSDWFGYAEPLARVFDYRNTFFHQPPYLDIMRPDPSMEHSADFLISSEVFEHVPPPVSTAFVNAKRLLKPHGLLVFSVPLTDARETIEHFPGLHDYTVCGEGDRWILKNTTLEGIHQQYDQLVFHGGPGSTLEMRQFSRPALIEEFRKAGFTSVIFYEHPVEEFGISWSHSRSFPVAARID